MSVTVVSCLYGDRGYDRFIGEWQASLRALTSRPEEIIVAADRDYPIPCAHVFVSDCKWWNPQAWYLQQAITLAMTEWVWILDIDDTAMPDALDGIEDVTADVWQMGFVRSDGETHIPPQLTASEYILAERNQFVGASAIRVAAFRECGGYSDVALQDWALWRNMARRGMTFQSSGRAHFNYLRHPEARGATELTAESRPAHLAEMTEREAVAS